MIAPADLAGDSLYQLEWAGLDKQSVPVEAFDPRPADVSMADIEALFANPGMSTGEIKRFASLFPMRAIEIDGAPYLDRYALHGWLPGDRKQDYGVNVYLHHFHAPDKARHLHNHPWPWAESRILSGRYLERRLGQNRLPLYNQRNPGDIVSLASDTYHSIDELDGDVWTLFTCAGSADPRPRQSWGFDVPELGGHIGHVAYQHMLERGVL